MSNKLYNAPSILVCEIDNEAMMAYSLGVGDGYADSSKPILSRGRRGRHSDLDNIEDGDVFEEENDD